MKIGEKIIMLRKKLDYSQEDLAEKLNVSRQAISRWENGDVLPDAQNVLQLSKLFQVSTDYLLNDDLINIDKQYLYSKEKQNEDDSNLQIKGHLICALCTSLAAICFLTVLVNARSNTELALACFLLGFNLVTAIVNYSLFFKKRKTR